MSGRIHTLIWLALDLVLAISAGQVWQSATITDTRVVVSRNGFESFPVIGLLLALQILLLFVLRYSSSSIRISLVLLLAVLTYLAGYEAATAAFTERPILSGVVEKATGVAGWSDQLNNAVSQVSAYSPSAYVFSVSLFALVLWLALGVLVKASKRKAQNQTDRQNLWVN